MSNSQNPNVRLSHAILISIIFAVLIIIPFQSVFATSTIARRVEAFCAPSPTMPDVNSCSSCHMTTNNRGAGDLTAAGVWSLNGMDSNFCPTAAPAPTPAPAPSPTPGTGMGMGSGPATGSMGMGVGASMEDDDDDMEMDDDDDDMEMDDDDDDMSAPAPMPPVTPPA